jgi:uncharacterized protein YecT (DUF1311 family)
MFRSSHIVLYCLALALAAIVGSLPSNSKPVTPTLPAQALASVQEDDREPDSTGMSIKLENCLDAADDYRSENDRQDCIGIHARPCIQRPENDNTLGMERCYQQEAAAWTSLLRRYNRKIGVARGPNQAFARTQTAWEAYRDARCSYYNTHFQGGSIARWLGARCVMIETARRSIDVIEFVPDLSD